MSLFVPRHSRNTSLFKGYWTELSNANLTRLGNVPVLLLVFGVASNHLQTHCAKHISLNRKREQIHGHREEKEWFIKQNTSHRCNLYSQQIFWRGPIKKMTNIEKKNARKAFELLWKIPSCIKKCMMLTNVYLFASGFVEIPPPAVRQQHYSIKKLLRSFPRRLLK